MHDTGPSSLSTSSPTSCSNLLRGLTSSRTIVQRAIAPDMLAQIHGDAATMLTRHVTIRL
jgi:hypothetical protein